MRVHVHVLMRDAPLTGSRLAATVGKRPQMRDKVTQKCTYMTCTCTVSGKPVWPLLTPFNLTNSACWRLQQGKLMAQQSTVSHQLTLAENASRQGYQGQTGVRMNAGMVKS